MKTKGERSFVGEECEEESSESEEDKDEKKDEGENGFF